MRVIFLGTNGWYSTRTGNTPCILLETRKNNIVLDAGDGIYKLNEFIEEKPTHIFLSHFHLEHLNGLHCLDKFNFKKELLIYGKKGTRKILQNLINSPFTHPWNKLSYQIKFFELKEGVHEKPVKFTCNLLPHSDPSLGFRFELEGKTITYCTDCGMSEKIVGLARNADLFICECSLKAEMLDEKWSHLNPIIAAEIALKANARKLVLTHFDAQIYRTMKERKEAEKKARKIFRNAVAAFDGMEIKI